MQPADLIGRVIVAAAAQFHVHEGGRDALLFLRLEFEDGSGVRFGSAGDGESVGIDGEPLTSYDMAEYGASEVRPFGGLPAQQRLEKALPLIDANGITFGVQLVTAAARVFVFNWGDELHAEPQLPDGLRREAGRPLPL